MEENVTNAGATLREARKRAGLTAFELAYRAGISSTTLSGWEKHDIPPGPSARWRLSRILGISTAELFPGIEPPPWETNGDPQQKRREEQAELRRRVPGHVTPPGLLDGEKL